VVNLLFIFRIFRRLFPYNQFIFLCPYISILVILFSSFFISGYFWLFIFVTMFLVFSYLLLSLSCLIFFFFMRL